MRDLVRLMLRPLARLLLTRAQTADPFMFLRDFVIDYLIKGRLLLTLGVSIFQFLLLVAVYSLAYYVDTWYVRMLGCFVLWFITIFNTAKFFIHTLPDIIGTCSGLRKYAFCRTYGVFVGVAIWSLIIELDLVFLVLFNLIVILMRMPFYNLITYSIPT